MAAANDTELTKLRFLEARPDVAGYARLRKLVGWNDLSLDAYAAGLASALYSISVYRANELVGCGRLIGDGAIYFYVQDIIVHPELQRRGIGRRIMDHVMAFLQARAPEGAFVGLMAAQDVERFYLSYGFRRRDVDRPGMFLVWSG